MFKLISSTQNPVVKRILQLQEKSRSRRKEGNFVIEGQRELKLAHQGGYDIQEIFFCRDLIPINELEHLLKNFPPDLQVTELDAAVYHKLAYRGSTEGVLGIGKQKDLSLKYLELHSTNPLILVAEAPEKPGNIGALLRTADAANVDAVLIANPQTDMYNPNIIRSSIGCLFTTRLGTGTSAEIIKYLRQQKISIYAAALQASVPYNQIDFTHPSAIVVGTEATGLSQEWLESSTSNIIIPMRGAIDSMNVSVAAGILIFEAGRQRNFQ